MIEQYQQMKKDSVYAYTYKCEHTDILDNLCEFQPKSSHPASIGKETGVYPFFTSSNKLSYYCDVADFKQESIIIGSGVNSSLHFSNNFSCSADNFIISEKTTVMIKYIYYYLNSNIDSIKSKLNGLGICHISKTDIENIKIIIPSLEIQQKIIKECEYYDEQTQTLENENKMKDDYSIIDMFLQTDE